MDWWKPIARTFRLTAEPSEPIMSGPSVGPGAIDDLIRETPELAGLYRSIGYDPLLREKISAHLGRLDSMILAVVPDMAGFRAAVTASVERMRSEGYPEDAFLTRVAAAGLSDAALLELLNRDPVRESLPFLERMPIRRAGEVSWRSPLAVSLPEKRPVDADAFLAVAESLRAELGLHAPSRDLTPIFSALDRAVRTPRGYCPAPLIEIREAIDGVLEAAIQQPRRKILDAFVLDWLRLSHFLTVALGAEAGSRTVPPQTVKDQAGSLADRVIEHAWMRPWPMRAALVLLLDLAALEHNRPVPLLRAVRDEVASGEYDAIESSRRLQEMQTGGVIVSSLVFALLRSQRVRGNR